MDSLTLKIHSFLKQTGSTGALTDTTSQNALQMVRFFEEEYDLQMLSFLENEWVDEQLERDLTYGDFSELRNSVPANRRRQFDAAVSSTYDVH
jgi:hypothetical protein